MIAVSHHNTNSVHHACTYEERRSFFRPRMAGDRCTVAEPGPLRRIGVVPSTGTKRHPPHTRPPFRCPAERNILVQASAQKLALGARVGLSLLSNARFLVNGAWECDDELSSNTLL